MVLPTPLLRQIFTIYNWDIKHGNLRHVCVDITRWGLIPALPILPISLGRNSARIIHHMFVEFGEVIRCTGRVGFGGGRWGELVKEDSARLRPACRRPEGDMPCLKRVLYGKQFVTRRPRTNSEHFKDSLRTAQCIDIVNFFHILLIAAVELYLERWLGFCKKSD